MKTTFSFKRIEKKYVLTPEAYEKFVAMAGEHIIADEHKRYTICNIYYDTDDYLLIRRSIEKPVYKEKLRIRSYGVPDAEQKIFVEIKKKYKGVVAKRRVIMPEEEAIDYINKGILPETEDQINKEIDWFMNLYHPKPKVFVGYDREAYKDRDDDNIRITFDRNLRWRVTDLDLTKGDYGTLLRDENFILMEIKVPSAAPLWLVHILSEMKLYPISFSKIGTVYKENIMWKPDFKGEKLKNGEGEKEKCLVQ